MAPAIVHFLVGASLFLWFAAPFALRYETDRNEVLWLVPIGGIWGLLPDVHHIAPVYREQLYAIHNSPVVDFFALHYTLDRPTIRELYTETVFGSILLFLAAVAVFSLCTSLRERSIVAETHRERAIGSVVAFLVAAGYAGVVAGMVLSGAGALELVSALLGREGLITAWLLLAPLSLLGGLLVWGVRWAIGSTRHGRHPIAGGTIGVPIGIASWAVVGTVVVPLWLRTVGVGAVPIPFLHWPSLPAIVLFCVAFGAVYATVRGAFDRSRSTRLI